MVASFLVLVMIGFSGKASDLRIFTNEKNLTIPQTVSDSNSFNKLPVFQGYQLQPIQPTWVSKVFPETSEQIAKTSDSYGVEEIFEIQTNAIRDKPVVNHHLGTLWFKRSPCYLEGN